MKTLWVDATGKVAVHCSGCRARFRCGSKDIQFFANWDVHLGIPVDKPILYEYMWAALDEVLRNFPILVEGFGCERLVWGLFAPPDVAFRSLINNHTLVTWGSPCLLACKKHGGVHSMWSAEAIQFCAPIEIM